jgi:uncharacterized membrane protein
MLKKLFKTSVWLKGFLGIVDILIGFLVLIFGTKIVEDLGNIFAKKLLEEPKDIIVNHLWNYLQNLSLSTEHFIAIYMIIFGVINLFLVFMILKKKVKLYPWLVAVLSLMIIYSILRFFHTHSLVLLVFTIWDSFIAAMLFEEYRNA